MDFENKLSGLRTLLKSDARAAERGFDELEKLLPQRRIEILRERAFCYAEQDQFARALMERLAALEIDPHSIGDLYFAGEYALQAGDVKRAEAFFKDCIGASLLQNDGYFIDTARLLAAYCLSRHDDRLGAAKLLESVPDDEVVVWLQLPEQEISKASIRERIGLGR
jgi:tetratricopeptide (TPR) repeat protein